jgi:TPR repeat protein
MLAMNKINLNFLKRILYSIYNSTGHNLLLQNAIQGNINSQYNLAIFYLHEMQNYVEAYAWAELACYRKHPHAANVKFEAQRNLSACQINEAWSLARNYKLNFS